MSNNLLTNKESKTIKFRAGPRKNSLFMRNCILHRCRNCIRFPRQYWGACAQICSECKSVRQKWGGRSTVLGRWSLVIPVEESCRGQPVAERGVCGNLHRRRQPTRKTSYRCPKFPFFTLLLVNGHYFGIQVFLWRIRWRGTSDCSPFIFG